MLLLSYMNSVGGFTPCCYICMASLWLYTDLMNWKNVISQLWVGYGVIIYDNFYYTLILIRYTYMDYQVKATMHAMAIKLGDRKGGLGEVEPPSFYCHSIGM